MPSAAWKQDGGGYIEERQKARGPEGLFAFRATGRGRIRCNFKRLGTYHNQRKTNLRMQHVNQEVLPIDIVDVAIVGIGPAHRPRIDKLDPVAAILNPRTTLHDDRLRYAEVMLAAEARAELLLRNALGCLLAFVLVPRD